MGNESLYEFECGLWRDALTRREQRFMQMFPDVSLNELYIDAAPIDIEKPKLEWLKSRFEALINIEARLLAAAEEATQHA